VDRPDPHPDLPAAVRDLITEHVDSLEKLELIALLDRHPVGWTAITAGEELRVPASTAESALAELRQAGILVHEAGVGYQCRPATPELTGAVEGLVRLYESDRVAILTLLASTALDRIRTSAAHTFADAFRVRGKKEKPDG